MAIRKARILILCKTYPSPSSKHAETSCVAGLEEGGNLIRLFPVPFRLVTDEQQFKKWQWVQVRVDKAKADRRGESHSVYVDTITLGDRLGTGRFWKERRELLAGIPTHEDFAALESARVSFGYTLGLLRPKKVIALEITPANCPDWTAEELLKLRQHEDQAALFDDNRHHSRPLLRKLPFDFHYVYACDRGGELVQYRHKIVDWEAGALFWTCKQRYGAYWERPFRAKLENELPSKDLMFLMGTVHRFPDQWLIVSLIYPPKQPDAISGQGSLFDL